MNTLLPAFLNLTGKACLVVGAGAVALQKIQQLINAEAIVTVIAPQVLEEIVTLEKDSKVTLLKRAYQHTDSLGYFLVISATSDHEVNAAIYQEASKHQILVNVVDCPALCNFYFGSVYQSDDLKIAVSTNGQCPTLAKEIRDIIGKTVGHLGAAITQLAAARKKIHEEHAGYECRKQAMQRVVATAIHDEALKKHHFHRGSVVLVGAGPGHPELITIRGKTAINLADVILYDALVNTELLEYVNNDAQKIFVGKKPGKCNPYKQDEINKMLIDFAQAGKLVVRIKGGDPFIFGRGCEELETLAKANISYEVVPGISAAIGAAAYSGIPLTHRTHNSSFAVVTAHQTNEKPLDWKLLWQTHNTIVIYMGMKALPDIVKQLLQANCPGSMPIAVVENATLPQQRILISTLEQVVSEAYKLSLTAPSIIFIGENVFLHETVFPCLTSMTLPAEKNV